MHSAYGLYNDDFYYLASFINKTLLLFINMSLIFQELLSRERKYENNFVYSQDFLKKKYYGISLVVRWLRFHASSAGDASSISGQGTKI